MMAQLTAPFHRRPRAKRRGARGEPAVHRTEGSCHPRWPCVHVISSPLGAITLAALRASSLARRDGTSGQSQTASQIALRAAPAAGEGREISHFTVESKAVGRAQTQGGT